MHAAVILVYHLNHINSAFAVFHVDFKFVALAKDLSHQPSREIEDLNLGNVIACYMDKISGWVGIDGGLNLVLCNAKEILVYRYRIKYSTFRTIILNNDVSYNII